MWTIFFNLEISLWMFRSKFHGCTRVSWANHLSTLDTLVLLGAAGFWRFSELEDPIHVPRTINTERVPTLSVQHGIQGQNCPNLAPFLLPTLLCSLSIQPVVFPQTSQSYLTWIQFLQLVKYFSITPFIALKLKWDSNPSIIHPGKTAVYSMWQLLPIVTHDFYQPGTLISCDIEFYQNGEKISMGLKTRLN